MSRVPQASLNAGWNVPSPLPSSTLAVFFEPVIPLTRFFRHE